MEFSLKLRLDKELAKIEESANDEEESGYYEITPDPSNFRHWTAILFILDDCPYQNAIYKINIDIPKNYPEIPPKVKFLDFKPYHLNIYPNGDICLSTLSYGWKNTYNLKIALDAILTFFSFPNENSPANSEVIRLFISDKKEYLRKIRENAVQSAKIIYQ